MTYEQDHEHPKEPHETAEIVRLLTGIFAEVKKQVESGAPRPLDGAALQAVKDYQRLVLAQGLKYRPDPPAGVKAVALGTGEIEVSWIEPTLNPDRYLIERCHSPNCNNFAPLFEAGAQVRSYVDRNLQANTTYRYRVRAYNALGHSDFSEVAEATTGGDSGPYRTSGKRG